MLGYRDAWWLRNTAEITERRLEREECQKTKPEAGGFPPLPTWVALLFLVTGGAGYIFIL